MQSTLLPLTLADLEELLAGAADTHRRMPFVRRGPRPPRSGWPDPALHAPAPWLTYANERTRGTLAPPEPRAIDQMDRVLGWLSQLSQRHALGVEWCRLLWARANGYSFQRIADKVSWTTPRPCSWSTARRKHQHALEALLVIATEAGRAQSKPAA